MKHSLVAALCLAHIVLLPARSMAAVPATLSPVEMFKLAETMRNAHRPRDAEAIFDALAHDPDPEIRAEARFRKGMMLAEEKRYREAAVMLPISASTRASSSRTRAACGFSSRSARKVTAASR